MVGFGTPFVSSTFSRVSTALSRDVILGNLRRSQEELFRIQEQLSTGLKILRPSDDPIGANRVQDFTLGITRNGQFLRNLETADGRLTMSDSSLSEANELANRAREILLSQAQSTATAQTRRLAAQEVTQLLQEAVNLANLRFEDRYLFGGSRTESAPFSFLGGDVVFRGDLTEFRAEMADGLRLRTNVSAAAFGALSDEIRGLNLATLQPVDLNPGVTLTTRLSDLNGGRGVTPGSLQLSGTGSATIDLRIARTVGDVVDLVNAQSGVTGITASINAAQNGLLLTRVPAGTIIVQEVSNGRTALDLGILTAPAGVPSPLTGLDLNPRLTKDTLVMDLLGGLGLSAGGIVVSNSSSTQALSATFGSSVFAAGARIEEVLNALNGSNVQIQAQINDQASGIDVFSRLSGGRLRISENGGTTATQLGLLSTLGRARIADLNSGNGLGTVDGPDVRITRKDGTQLLFDLDTASSVQSFVDAVNADPNLTALIAGSTIVITDTTAPAGTLAIENTPGSFAATNLGIAGSVTGAGAVTITGTAVSFAGVQNEGLFTALVRMRDALQANDAVALNAAGRLLDRGQDRVLDARTETGARVAGLGLTRNRLQQEKLELEKLRSSTRDADMTEVATRFQLQQTVLQASLATAARILETNIFNFL
jgi:flagellar hook-associated protein 3 FlgL